MPGEMFALFDPRALAIVLGGTVIATLARCGRSDLGAAFKTLFQIRAVGFEPDRNRIALARCVPEIRRRGILCAEAPLPPDPSLARLIKAYLENGSLEAFHRAACVDRTARESERNRALRVFDYAAEMAPIFGLVGTLFALSQLTPTGGVGTAQTAMSAVTTAVLSSLYGVLTAHLICLPLAGAIERKGQREEKERSAIIDWIQMELTGGCARAKLAVMAAA